VAQSKLNSLAMLLDSEDDFTFAFASKHDEVKSQTTTTKLKPNQQLGSLQ
jgi:hypothetical protein